MSKPMSQVFKSMPSLLSFRGSIRPSVFFMSAAIRHNGVDSIVPVLVQDTSLLGVFQNEIARETAVKRAQNPDTDPKKNPNNANPQKTQIATMPPGSTALLIEGSLHIHNASTNPEACNIAEFAQAYQVFHGSAIRAGAFHALAERYVMNLITGQWLWRNRILSDQIEVTVGYKDPVSGQSVTLTFDANGYHDVVWPSAIVDLHENQREQAETLTAAIAQALVAPRRAALVVNVSARLDVQAGVEVFPSQEMKLDKDEDDSSKLLFAIPVPGTQNRQAAMHAQKVGNALRTVDRVNGRDQAPIAINAYGTVSRQARAYRLDDGKSDFYTLLPRIREVTDELQAVQSPEQLTPDHLYMVGMFVLGGVFGETKETKKGKGSKGAKAEARGDDSNDGN